MAYHIPRVNSLIRHEMSEILRREVKDPRLGTFVTITAVETSADLRYAKVFITRLGTYQERRDTLSALQSAAGYLRRKLAARLRLRRIPELAFRWDDSIERGARLFRLLEEVAHHNNPEDTPPGQG